MICYTSTCQLNNVHFKFLIDDADSEDVVSVMRTEVLTTCTGDRSRKRALSGDTQAERRSVSVCEVCGGGLAGPGPHGDSLLSPAGTADISMFRSQGKHEVWNCSQRVPH